MDVKKLLGVIIGLLTIVVTLAISPSIGTANATVAAGNLTNLIGMSVIVTFGAPLAIFGLLALGGVFTVGAWKGTTSMKEMLTVIITAVIVIVGLTFMDSIVDYTNTLIAAGSGGFETTLYGIIPLFVYLVVIGLAGWQTVSRARSYRKGKKSKAAVKPQVDTVI